MKVLIACEKSQTVCKAFRELGHEAYSCDIQDCSGGESQWHIMGDALKEAYSGKYDLMIAHPPCTYMSNAGARWMYPTAGNLDQDRLVLALEAKDFFMKLLNAPINRIAVENPQPLRVVELPKHNQVIQPYEYGHSYSKKTLLWLNNLPPLKPTNIKEDYKPYLPSNTGGKSRDQKHTNGIMGKGKRSETFSGIAKAMAEQWGNLSLE